MHEYNTSCQATSLTCPIVRSKLNVWLWLASLSLLPITSPHLEVLFFLKNVWASKMVKIAGELWRLRECKLPFLLCQDTLEGTSFGGKWSEARYYGGVKEWTETISLLHYLFSLFHLGSHYCLLNTVPDWNCQMPNDCAFHSNVDRLIKSLHEKTTSCWLWPGMS